MKAILLSLSILIFNIHLSHAQTKKIALRSHSGANSSFTIYVPDEFGLGPIDYRTPEPIKKKKCPLKIKPIKPTKAQSKDSLDSIQFCTPLPPLDSITKQNSSTPKSKPKVKQKSTTKTLRKRTCSAKTETELEPILTEEKQAKTQLAGFVPTKSSESLLVLLLSIPALLFFIISIKKP